MRPETYSRFSFDRKPGEAKSFVQARKVERYYAAQLRKIARHIGELVSGAPPSDVLESSILRERLRKYAEILRPWATSVAGRMIADVNRKDRDAWRARSAEMGRLLRQEIETAPTGEAMRRLMVEQVGLITSLPTDAAQRVHHLVTEGLSTSARASEVAAEIMRTGEVTRSRANLIARTEVGRAATTLTQARAQHVGSSGYIWRAAMDTDTRQRHRELNGKFFPWDNPPVAGERGERYNPGCGPNCRCYAEPVIPE